jgi:hypothetical protein
MTTFADLPAAAVRLITRAARTRHIPGTNRSAQVCRSWRYAAIDSEDQEQLQLLLALEGLPADTVHSTIEWMKQHGSCVTSLYIMYEPDSAPIFQQLPLSTAPLVGLARLEVDGPDTLVALAPVLPQLVALTHLRAWIALMPSDRATEYVFSAEGVPLQEVPSLQQLCPGLRSLHLVYYIWRDTIFTSKMSTRLSQLLPAPLEELHLEQVFRRGGVQLPCAILASLSSLRRLTVTNALVNDHLDLLLCEPGVDYLDMCGTICRVGHMEVGIDQWIDVKLSMSRHRPQHLSKLVGLCFRTQSDALLPAPVLAALSGVRKLAPVGVECSAEVCVQQLSALSCLQHLSFLSSPETAGNVAAAVAALSSVQQLTYLRVNGHVEVSRSAWAAVLPHLSQLQVLAVHKELLLEGGLVAELPRLAQLQCLYVEDLTIVDWNPAALGTQVAAHLSVLSQCSRLRAVLCWSHANAGDETAQPLWVLEHEGRLHVSCWHRWRRAAEQGRVVCPRPCPHLPGVWELQQQAQATGPGGG